MNKKYREHIASDTEHITPALREKKLRTLISEHTCTVDAQPHWCVWGKDQHGGMGLLYWVQNSKRSEQITRTIAELITQLGGDARAEKTEWNETIADNLPIYERESVLDILE